MIADSRKKFLNGRRLSREWAKVCEREKIRGEHTRVDAAYDLSGLVREGLKGTSGDVEKLSVAFEKVGGDLLLGELETVMRGRKWFFEFGRVRVPKRQRSPSLCPGCGERVRHGEWEREGPMTEGQVRERKIRSALWMDFHDGFDIEGGGIVETRNDLPIYLDNLEMGGKNASEMVSFVVQKMII